MNPDEKRVVLNESGRALWPHLIQFTVSIVNTRGLSIELSNKWKVFSGTLISVENHLFVATASHCIAEEEHPLNYLVLADHGKFPPDGSFVTRQ